MLFVLNRILRKVPKWKNLNWNFHETASLVQSISQMIQLFSFINIIVLIKLLFIFSIMFLTIYRKDFWNIQILAWAISFRIK